jgi:hypothetical protein
MKMPIDKLTVLLRAEEAHSYTSAANREDLGKEDCSEATVRSYGT